MARELVYTGFITVDGSIDSPGGTAEGHPNGGWVFETPFSPEAYSLKGEELGETSALLFGRRSYDAFSRFWPGSEDHAAYKALPKHVVSSSLAEADLVDGWGEQTILRSLDDVAALKETDGGAIFIHGSGDLARQLGAAGLIDRYNLLMFPFLLTGGRSIFGDAAQSRTDLRLRDSAAYDNGVVKLVYDVVR
ncbi:dihydrofolate reductase family protein [Agrococcus jejuensis]|uniref:RibD C-terminal domain-containing protein n=1 Tax=Agrococcus jejuensis TaxID=399736 RepID=A0A1G8FUW9_9MICO|nr:dihydrofolate reductase family protein [Agrococcus jejuensis]SDH85870.1 RibD C-terminal domain-containing protein [Agrococcus jejuensis]